MFAPSSTVAAYNDVRALQSYRVATVPPSHTDANFENYRLQEPDKALQSFTQRLVDGNFSC